MTNKIMIGLFVGVLVLGISASMLLYSANDDKETFKTLTGTLEENEAVSAEQHAIAATEVSATDTLSSSSNANTSTSAVALTQTEIDWLILMREEEKLARDVYQALGDSWGLPIFYNVAASEQTHTDAVKTMLEQYGIPDPIQNDTAGVFTDEALQALYLSLVEKGSLSVIEALMVGAAVEELDIRDLTQAQTDTSEDVIRAVYANLQKGSRNHLRAFARQLAVYDARYSPEYISPAAYEEIIASPPERGWEG